MKKTYAMSVPFRTNAKNLMEFLQGKSLVYPDAITALERRYLAASFDQIDTDPELAAMVIDSTIKNEVSLISRMSRMHAREYERANRPRTLDTQVGPLTEGEPTLIIKTPGIKNANWRGVVRTRIENFLNTYPYTPPKDNQNTVVVW